MSHRQSHILVMGAGAVGGYFGGRIAERTDHRVTFIARGKHLEAMKTRGLEIRSPDGNATVTPRVRSEPGQAEPPDYILFTVKSFDTLKAIEQIRPVVAEQTQILTLQNGIENYPKLIGAIGEDRVIQGLCKIGAGIPEPGIIEHSAMGKIIFGETDGTETRRIARLKELFDQAEIPGIISADIHHDVWVKFAWNCVFNMLTACAGITIDRLFEKPETEALCHTIFGEVRKIAEKKDIRLTKKDEERVIESAKKLEGFVTSTLQDRRKGKKLEYDAFTGAMIRLAVKHDVAIPHIATLHGLLRAIDKTGGNLGRI